MFFFFYCTEIVTNLGMFLRKRSGTEMEITVAFLQFSLTLLRDEDLFQN